MGPCTSLELNIDSWTLDAMHMWISDLLIVRIQHLFLRNWLSTVFILINITFSQITGFPQEKKNCELVGIEDLIHTVHLPFQLLVKMWGSNKNLHWEGNAPQITSRIVQFQHKKWFLLDPQTFHQQFEEKVIARQAGTQHHDHWSSVI